MPLVKYTEGKKIILLTTYSKTQDLIYWTLNHQKCVHVKIYDGLVCIKS